MKSEEVAGQSTCFCFAFSIGSSQGCALMQEAAEGGMTDVCRVLLKPTVFSGRGKLVWLACETLLIHDVAGRRFATQNSARLRSRRCERPAGDLQQAHWCDIMKQTVR